MALEEYGIGGLFALPLESTDTCKGNANALVDQSSTVHIQIDDLEFELRIPEEECNDEKKTLFTGMVWNGAKTLARFLYRSQHPDLMLRGKRVLEFGAAAGLPSIMCHRLGAAVVCSSDYPAGCVLQTLRYNLKKYSTSEHGDDGRLCNDYRKSSRVGSSTISVDAGGIDSNNCISDTGNTAVVGHIWGRSVKDLLAVNGGDQYDIVIAAECIWRHEQHEDLLRSVIAVLRPNGLFILTFSHHIPGLEAKDDGFIQLATDAEYGFTIDQQHQFKEPHMWQSSAFTDMYLFVLRRSVS